jgi:hypothetical protein
MSTKLYFREGDRVMARVSKSPIKAGMIGTIQRVFLSVIDLYDVQFDDLPHPYILHGDQLAPLQQAGKPPS